MKRTLAAVLAFAAAAAPDLARAQQAPAYEEPSECTTTTTVRCTGAAARYAVPPVPGAQPPVAQPPPPPAAPAIPPPIVAPPPGAYPYYNRPIIYADLRLGDGWKLVQGADGSLWKERKVSTMSPGLFGGGLALFSISWLGGIIGGAVGDSDRITAYSAMMPVFGAWANAAMEAGRSSYCDSYYGGCGNGNKDLRVAGWAIDGVLQATGFIMFLIGTAAGPDKVERRPLTVIPSMVGNGGGVSAAGQF